MSEEHNEYVRHLLSPVDLSTRRVGPPCSCGERDEVIEKASGLFVCIGCGVPAPEQPSTIQQQTIRARYARAQSIVAHGNPTLEALAQRIAGAWSDVLDVGFAVDIARTIVTPLAYPAPELDLSVRKLARDVLKQRRRDLGLGLSDAMIEQLVERAARAEVSSS